MWRTLILASALASGALASEPLRVLCWNLHHGVGEDGKLDLARVAHVIRHANPDLVALQEVDNQCSRSRKIDQTADLARLTGMHAVFGKAMDFQGGGYGQAILSKTPIQSSQVHPLPSRGEPRIAFEATVTVNGKAMKLVSVHFGLDDLQRLAQAESLAKTLAQSPTPLILCGDFNDGPESPTLKCLRKTLTAVPKKAPVLTQPAGKPEIEIDHFLVRGLSPAADLTVVPETVASDHRPVFGEFTRKERNQLSHSLGGAR